MTCFECDEPADHQHHVVPKSMGGTRTIPLCERHHGMVHGRDMVNHRRLTSAALQHMKSQGKRVSGHLPYGYTLHDDGETLVPREPEMVIVNEAKALRAAGVTLRGITATLNERGHRSRVGKPFGLTQVARFLDS